MAIVPYSEQNEYDLVHSGQDCRGWPVADQAGNVLGRVTELMIDTETEMVDSIIVDKSARIPAADIALGDNRVLVRGVTRGEGETAAARAGAAAGTAGEVVLPVVEEQLQLGKRQVERGGVRVRTGVEETPVEQEVSLREEHVRVERRPADRVVEAAPQAFQEGVIEVATMREEPVVAKQARVVEEVVIDKNVSERVETVRDTVRRSEVEVDDLRENQAAPRDRSNR